MSVVTETKKHYVDLWEMETILRRKCILIEAPSDWDAERLKRLDGLALNQLAIDYGCDAEWQTDEVDENGVLREILVVGPLPDDMSADMCADIVFVEDECGELIDAESGDPAPFVF